MLDHDEKSKRFTKGLWNFTKGFTLLLTYEVIEELLEEAIAWTITTVMARALSFIIVVLLTQTTKVTIKGLAKGLTVLMKPIVKKITYKVGNDKIDKIRRIYKAMKNVFVKFFAFVASNKKTITSTVASIAAAFGSGTAAGGGMMAYNVGGLPQYAYYLIGAAVAVVMFALCELGVLGKGPETPEQYKERLEKEQAEKEEKKALKEAEAKAKEEEEKLLKAIEAEEAKKLADEEAKRAELAKQQREEEEKKKEEQTRMQAQQIAREYEDAKVQGFDGTLREFIAQKLHK